MEILQSWGKGKKKRKKKKKKIPINHDRKKERWTTVKTAS